MFLAYGYLLECKNNNVPLKNGLLFKFSMASSKLFDTFALLMISGYEFND